MKKYKLTLSIGGFSFVHASRYQQEGHWTKFYRGDELVAEFATATLRKIEEPPSSRQSDDDTEGTAA